MFDAIMSELGSYLHREIAQRGLSLRKAAARANLSYGTLYHVLNGQGTPELPTLQKIADGLNLPLARLQELAGFGVDTATAPSSDPLYGFTDEEREIWRRASPERKKALMDLLRQLGGE